MTGCLTLSIHQQNPIWLSKYLGLSSALMFLCPHTCSRTEITSFYRIQHCDLHFAAYLKNQKHYLVFRKTKERLVVIDYICNVMVIHDVLGLYLQLSLVFIYCDYKDSHQLYTFPFPNLTKLMCHGNGFQRLILCYHMKETLQLVLHFLPLIFYWI